MKREWLAVMRDAAVPRRYRLRVRERLLVIDYEKDFQRWTAKRKVELLLQLIRARRRSSTPAGSMTSSSRRSRAGWRRSSRPASAA